MNEYESRSALKVVDERIASPRPNRGRCEGARFPRLARLLHRMRANHITVFCASEVGPRATVCDFFRSQNVL